MAGIENPPAIYMAIETYLKALHQHSTAEELMERIITEDFETGFRGGDMWQGIDGLREYLCTRSEFFDQHSELKAMLSLGLAPNGDIEATTRLDFFMRRWRAPSATSEELAGTAFHTWRLRTVGGTVRVVSQVIDGFANLNDNARRLISSPVLGQHVDE